MKRENRNWLMKVAALFVLLGSSAASQAASGSFEKSFAIDGDAVIDVTNQKGTGVVRGDDVDEVTIRARISVAKRYTRTDPQKAGKVIGEIKRSPPIEADGNRIVVSELTKHTHTRYATISYEILVPRGSTVNVRSVSGDVLVSGVTGKVNATSETGEVTVAVLNGEDRKRNRG